MPQANRRPLRMKIILICDFSRSVLNTRSYPALAPRPQIRIISFSAGCVLLVGEKNLYIISGEFMTNCIAVGLGGFIGATLRYLIGLIPVCETTLFPVKTFFINIAGCIAIAFVAMLASKGSIPNPKLVLFLKTGICGGFTTFSTFALESATLMKSGHPKVAFLYMLLSILVGVGAIFITDLIQIQ